MGCSELTLHTDVKFSVQEEIKEQFWITKL